MWWGQSEGPSSAPQFLYTLSLGPGKLGFALLTTPIPPPLILRCDKAALEPRYTPQCLRPRFHCAHSLGRASIKTGYNKVFPL